MPDLAAAQVTATATLTAAKLAASASVVAALVSFGSAAFNAWTTQQSQRRLEQLRASLSIEAADLNAKRDYEYEARKRLYAECEPAHFRLLEAADAAKTRIVTLSRIWEIEGSSHFDNWIRDDGHRNYTLFRIVAPVAHFAVLREKMTDVDLRLSPRIHRQYVLGRILYDSFADDDALAHAPGLKVLEYRPDGSRTGGGSAPDYVFQRQGITYQRLEALITAMRLGNDVVGPAQFLRGAQEEGSELHDAILNVDYLLRDFSPESRPVLWRLLCYQAAIYNGMARLNKGDAKAGSAIAFDADDPYRLDLPGALIEGLTPFLTNKNARFAREIELLGGVS